MYTPDEKEKRNTRPVSA